MQTNVREKQPTNKTIITKFKSESGITIKGLKLNEITHTLEKEAPT